MHAVVAALCWRGRSDADSAAEGSGHPLYVAISKIRHVRLNGQHPQNVTPSWGGDSVGHYEGDTLVIDTVGVKVGPLSAIDNYGTPYSAALHLVERIRLIDGNTANAAAEQAERDSGRVDVEMAARASIPLTRARVCRSSSASRIPACSRGPGRRCHSQTRGRPMGRTRLAPIADSTTSPARPSPCRRRQTGFLSRFWLLPAWLRTEESCYFTGFLLGRVFLRFLPNEPKLSSPPCRNAHLTIRETRARLAFANTVTASFEKP